MDCNTNNRRPPHELSFAFAWASAGALFVYAAGHVLRAAQKIKRARRRSTIVPCDARCTLATHTVRGTACTDALLSWQILGMHQHRCNQSRNNASRGRSGTIVMKVQ